MSDEALLELATAIGKEDEYREREVADDYRGAWYADMERILVESGTLTRESLSALATVKLYDVVFDEPISVRRHGWLMRGGAGVHSPVISLGC